MTMENVRPEHPKPQFMRESWMNLNGWWQFAEDPGNSGEERRWFRDSVQFDRRINVPFCPESRLSGIENKDFSASVWYKRTVSLTADQIKGRTVLHFGACDYRTTVYVNERKAGFHKGGYVSFSFEISDYVREGNNLITVHAEDDTRNPMIPSGKQSSKYESYGCYYTRTTGIWQTVWLEFTPLTYIRNLKFFPDTQLKTLNIHAETAGAAELTIRAAFNGKDMGETSIRTDGGFVNITLPLKETHLWEIGKGGLYDLELTYGEDQVKSYFGLRTIDYRDHKFYLNNKSVFQRLVLDQGFYPEGIYTAPSDEELARDIDHSMAMGFNGARLHEKIFEERFLYHADRKGYIVWGEYPNWGLDHTDPQAVYGIIPEWLEEINRDFNHPSIVGWCPFNETWDKHGRRQCDDVLSMVYTVTRAVDPTRPCIDTSGNYHVITDIYDVHCYEQDPVKMAERYEKLETEGIILEPYCNDRQKYKGDLPLFISEYGGIRWTQEEGSFGYGTVPETREEFLKRLKGLTDVLLDHKGIFAFCYTQLTDVEQEQNGLYTYDRIPKFDPEAIAEIIGRRAAIED